MCDKIIQYSLFFFIFFSLFLLLHWDTKSTVFFYFARNMSCVCVCVCECVMVASLRFYLATDESASVATTAGATLTAISQRQLRFPLLQTTTTTTINNSSVATIAVFLVTGFDRRVGVWSGCVSVCCCCLHSTLAHSWCHTHTFVQDAGQTYVRAHTYKQILLFSYEQGKQCVSVLFLYELALFLFFFLLI